MSKESDIRIRTQCTCLLILLLLLHVEFAASKEPKAEYEKEIFMGADTAKFGDTCIASHALMSADDFFVGLKVAEKQGKLKFRKGSKTVDNFPNEISVEVRMVIVECPLPGDAVERSLTPDFMRSLRFEAQWKTALKLRPVQNVSVEVSLKPEGIFWDRWIYNLTIRDQSVPLTDHLIVTVFSKQDKRIARFSGQL